MRHLFIFLASLSLLSARERPNIIYILVDDAGYGDFSCYGQTRFQTPNVDRLAKEGLKFTQHYAGSTVCAPSRSALMTGLHTGHTPIRGNQDVTKNQVRLGQVPLPAASFTIAEALKAGSYATGAFGKWGLGHPGSTGDPLKQGFDRFYGYNDQWNAHTYYPTYLYDDHKKVTLDGKTYTPPLIMKEALSWIRAQKDRPFFCFLPMSLPHAAMHAPEEVVAPFRKKFPQFESTPSHDRFYNHPPLTKNPAAQFAGMMTVLDRGVGQVLNLLKELELDEHTIVMFSSDNGPHREGGHLPRFFNSNGGLRGFKRDLTEGGIRTPFLVRWPGHVAAGTTSNHISAHWDLLPTVCELAGQKIPPNIDGISLTPTLLGKGEQKQHDYLYWEFSALKGRRAIRFGNNGEWKAIQYQMSSNPHAPIRLHHLTTDPHEDRDVSKKHPDLIKKAQDIFQKAHTPSDLFPFKWEQH